MEEKLDQLHKNKAWKLIHKSKLEPGHLALGGK